MFLHHDAFLPGYPLLLKGASLATHDLVLAGILVSAVAELAALLVIHELVRRERDVAVARFAVWAADGCGAGDCAASGIPAASNAHPNHVDRIISFSTLLILPQAVAIALRRTKFPRSGLSLF